MCNAGYYHLFLRYIYSDIVRDSPGLRELIYSLKLLPCTSWDLDTSIHADVNTP